MELEFKPDFEEARRNWRKFWDGELGRPALALTVPKGGSPPPPYPKGYPYGQSGDVDGWLGEIEAHASGHRFLFEAIPAYHLSFAPDHFSALLGADIRLHPDSETTAWGEPFVQDWDDAEIAFREDGFWWERTVAFLRAFRRRFDGRALLVPPNIQGGLDCLSAIRGNANLLTDLMDCPEKVKRALETVNGAVAAVRAAYAAEMDLPTWGSVNRHLFYSQQMIDVPQCDFSCMISPDMFREFEMPALEAELEGLGQCDYHLDGPGAVQHLESICELDKISVIQWQPGAGAAAEQDWTPLYQKIDALGRGLLVAKNDGAALAKELWGRTRVPMMFVHCNCKTMDEAAEIAEYFVGTTPTRADRAACKTS